MPVRFMTRRSRPNKLYSSHRLTLARPPALYIGYVRGSELIRYLETRTSGSYPHHQPRSPNDDVRDWCRSVSKRCHAIYSHSTKAAAYLEGPVTLMNRQSSLYMTFLWERFFIPRQLLAMLSISTPLVLVSSVPQNRLFLWTNHQSLTTKVSYSYHLLTILLPGVHPETNALLYTCPPTHLLTSRQFGQFVLSTSCRGVLGLSVRINHVRLCQVNLNLIDIHCNTDLCYQGAYIS